MRYTVLLAGLLVMLLSPLTAHAANSFITERSGLRAGPGERYPELTIISKNVGVNLLGCLSGWNWCEVETRGLHGWVKAGHVGTVYRGRRVGINNWGPRIGVSIVGFEERPYWDRYYYDRDFYIVRYGRHDHHDHDDWNHHKHCYDPDHDRDCHVIVRHHDHDDDHDDNDWHHDNDRDNDGNVYYHTHNYNN